MPLPFEYNRFGISGIGYEDNFRIDKLEYMLYKYVRSLTDINSFAHKILVCLDVVSNEYNLFILFNHLYNHEVKKDLLEMKKLQQKISLPFEFHKCDNHGYSYLKCSDHEGIKRLIALLELKGYKS